MAINKVEVEILPVGQGSCNVVKGLNAAGQLEYLAILDAGGSSNFGRLDKNDPSINETIKMLVKYMKDRAVAMGTAAQTGLYADLLLISHSDSDHYNIIHNIAEFKDDHISVNSTGKGKKTTKALKKTSALLNNNEGNPSPNIFAFITYESDEDILPMYQYMYEAEIESEEIFNYTYFHRIVYCGLQNYTEEIYFNGEKITFNRVIDFFNIPCINMTFIYNLGDTKGYSVLFLSIIQCSENKIKIIFENSVKILIDKELPANITAALSILLESTILPDDKYKKCFENAKNKLAFIYSLLKTIFINDPLLNLSIDDIKKELGFYSAVVTAPPPNSIEFGDVRTSSSLKEPAGVNFLKKCKKKSLLFFPPSAPSEIYLMTLYPNLIAYNASYPGTNNESFDPYFRNMNSIITLVGVKDINKITPEGPIYIFPGDATVQNLWYNGINNIINAIFIHGNGNNFLALPHHGSSRTSYGFLKKPDGTDEAESVFFQFLKKADPQYLYVSAGYKSSHGHPNIWTMNECAKYLAFKYPPPQPTLPDNIVYYNTKDEAREANFAFCKYDKPLFGTVTLTADTTTLANLHKIEAAGYRLTFQGAAITHGETGRVNLGETCDNSKIKTFPGPGGTFPVTAVRTLPNHAVFNFVFKD